MIKNIKRIEFLNPQQINIKKVAAYARVSTGKDTMIASLSAQVSYYSEYIQKNKNWSYVGVYADEAVSGTKENRVEFQKMLDDCKQGEIDLIITKSISRFARNTVTVLETVRFLKELNIEVYFERENIWSLSGDGELMLSILSSFAQEESKSVSDNCKWRLRDKMKKGMLHGFRIYGYKSVNGVLEVEPKEAQIVKQIFAQYLGGRGVQTIANNLADKSIPTVLGGEWSKNTISKMLSNEKYTGDLLLQKTFIIDHMTKKKHFNNGELPQYYVEDAHEAIIDKETFNKVQLEKQKRSCRKGEISQTYNFSGKIACGICGKNYRRKINNAGTKYAKTIWICSTYNAKGKKHCSSYQIPESVLEENVPTNFKSILVPKKGVLEVILQDDSTVTINWENSSRADTWSAKKEK